MVRLVLLLAAAASTTMLALPPSQRDTRPAWSIRTSRHFDVYFQSPEGDRVADVIEAAERAYRRVSFGLKHELKARMPLILVRADRDLPRNRPDATALVIASGAPDNDHLMLSLESLDARPSIVAHELTHQFIFELLPQAWRDSPSVLEGLCDHQSGVWDPAALATLRDRISAGQIPSVESLASDDRHWNHALLEFVEAEYGAQGVQRFLASIRNGSSGATALGVDSNGLNAAFKAYVTSRLGRF